jgi:hypothetical protein
MKSNDEESSRRALETFRSSKNSFYHELFEFANQPGLVSSFDSIDPAADLVAKARAVLLRSFSSYAAQLEPIVHVPVVFLPFINFSENPFIEILGFTTKLDSERSIIVVKSGAGSEFLTTMHEYLHTSVRGLPGVFEEGYCRHSLECLGADKNRLSGVSAFDPDTIKKYFGEIFYPHLLVSLLAGGAGARAVSDAFFCRDFSRIADIVKVSAGRDIQEIDRPFQENSFRKVALEKSLGELNKPSDDNFRETMEILLALAGSFGDSLSGTLKESINKLERLMHAHGSKTER